MSVAIRRHHLKLKRDLDVVGTTFKGGKLNISEIHYPIKVHLRSGDTGLVERRKRDLNLTPLRTFVWDYFNYIYNYN